MPRDDDLIPPAVRRRLTLNRLGFRLRAGAWVHPDLSLVLDEEQVDRMSQPRWARVVTRWRQEAREGNGGTTWMPQLCKQRSPHCRRKAPG